MSGHDDLGVQPVGEALEVDPVEFAEATSAAINSGLDDADAKSGTGHEAFGKVTDETGKKHEITAEGHEFVPTGIAGRLVLKLKDKVDGNEKVIVGVAVAAVSVAAALAVRHTIKPRQRKSS